MYFNHSIQKSNINNIHNMSLVYSLGNKGRISTTIGLVCQLVREMGQLGLAWLDLAWLGLAWLPSSRSRAGKGMGDA